MQVIDAYNQPIDNATSYLPVMPGTVLDNIEFTCRFSSGCILMTFCNDTMQMYGVDNNANLTLRACVWDVNSPVINVYARNVSYAWSPLAYATSHNLNVNGKYNQTWSGYRIEKAKIIFFYFKL